MSEYKFSWIPGSLAQDPLFEQMSALYSDHYGVWGDGGPTSKGSPIKLSAQAIRKYGAHESASLALAHLQSELVGYAIVIRLKAPHRGFVSWVTQFVVHKNHRRQGIGKELLFSTWAMSNHYAWGILTSNPYAVRALEAATRRRCQPSLIESRFPFILETSNGTIPYINSSTEREINSETAQANTKFAVSHESLDEMLQNVSTEKPWTLGTLQANWEWIAFTFRSQEQAHLSPEDIEKMLKASDQITKRAYERMQLTSDHAWTRHTDHEVSFIAEHLNANPGTALLDFGCGSGRHCAQLQARGVQVTGVDYINVVTLPASFTFQEADCRTVRLQSQFDAAICIYDVVGSYANDFSNYEILKNLRYHLKQGAYCLISVMSMEYTEQVAKHVGDFFSNPDVLLDLPPSDTMETTGDVFNGDLFFLDKDRCVVYRKEQFSQGSQLPAELIVRDRRYYKADIKSFCESAGFSVQWARQVKAGEWDREDSSRGKENLLLCRADREPQELPLLNSQK